MFKGITVNDIACGFNEKRDASKVSNTDSRDSNGQDFEKSNEKSVTSSYYDFVAASVTEGLISLGIIITLVVGSVLIRKSRNTLQGRISRIRTTLRDFDDKISRLERKLNRQFTASTMLDINESQTTEIKE